MSDATDNPAWNEVKVRLPVGAPVKGMVIRVAQFGVFVDLAVGLDGLLRVPEMAGPGPKTVDDYPQVGEPVDVRVLHHDDRNRQLVLIQKDLALTDQH
jgi:small subunit ribosomal protein S1